MNNITQNEQLDLFYIIETIWSGKWKIVAFVFALVLAALAFIKQAPPPASIAITPIKVISSAEIDQYATLNSLGFFVVGQEDLLSLYNERLTRPETLQDVFTKLQFIDQQNYDDELEYISAVKALTSKVELLPPVNTDGTKRGISRKFWTLRFKYHDRKKWLTALKQLDEIATFEVFEILNNRFKTLVRNNSLSNKFLLEDSQTDINNMLNDYKKETSSKLAYLSEQANIARTLGVAQNTIGAQTFGVGNGFVANVDIASPYYLRGYEAIEKEIELISSRKEAGLFIDGMIEIERKIRSIKQDKTIIRAQSLLLNTPLNDNTIFRAVTITIDGTAFQSTSKRRIIILIAAVMGGMIGVIYVLTANTLKNRKNAATE